LSSFVKGVVIGEASLFELRLARFVEDALVVVTPVESVT